MSKDATPTYSIEIKIGDEVLKGSGTTVLEALRGAGTPKKIVGKLFLTLSDGARSTTTLFMPSRAKRLFYPTAQYIQAKYLGMLLK